MIGSLNDTLSDNNEMLVDNAAVINNSAVINNDLPSKKLKFTKTTTNTKPKGHRQASSKPTLPPYFKIELLKKLHPTKLISLPLLERTTGNYFFWRSRCLYYGLPEIPSIQSFYEKTKNNTNIGTAFLTGNYITSTLTLNIPDVTRISITKNNIYLASDTGKIINFNRKLKNIEKLNFHCRGVWALDAQTRQVENKEERILASGSIDRTVVIHLNEKRFVFKNHSFTIRDIKIRGDFIIAASRDHTMTVYKQTNGHYMLLYTLEGHKDSVRAIDLDDKHLVSGSYDGTVKLWNYKKGKLMGTIINHEAKVYSVINGKKLIVSSDFEGIVKVFDKQKKKVVFSKQISNAVIPYLKFMYSYFDNEYQERYLYTASIDGSVYQLDLLSLTTRIVMKSIDAILNIDIFNNIVFVATKRAIKVFSETGELIRDLLSLRHIVALAVMDCCVVVFEEDGRLKMRMFVHPY
ncbi:F-box/WD repeat-containing protein sel-10 [Cucumispora dikerogammari]|nr:F-box/WD repeat-containing protein sel-10 [Cucumispora dikerogammari]